MSRPKIVLYNPRAVFYTMPLALVAVGSALSRDRCEVVVVDGRLEPDPLSRLIVEAEGALLVGMSVLTGSPLDDALRIARGLKRARPDLPIVWGGWHPSLFPRECLEDAAIDVVVAGQGEETMVEIVDRLSNGAPLSGCAGTAHRVDGAARLEPGRGLRDLNGFPAHDYTLLPVEVYFDRKAKRQIDYISSQGCRFRCGFCADPAVYARGWVGLAPDRVAEEASDLWRRYHYDELAFQDETFFTQRTRVLRMAEEFLRRQLSITWTATMRADQGCRLGEADFALLKRSGLSRVMIGVESAWQPMLDWMEKDVTVEQVIDCAERCARHDIGAIFNFIVGFPGEPPESVDATMALMKRLRRMRPDFETPVFYYRPYPGSPIAARAGADGHRFPRSLDEWAGFDYVGARGPWVSGHQWQRIERFKFYLRHAWGPSSALRRPLRHLARWRLEQDFYDFPVEKHLVELVRPPQPLS